MEDSSEICLKLSYNKQSKQILMKKNQTFKKTIKFVGKKFQLTNHTIKLYHNEVELNEHDTVETAKLVQNDTIAIVAIKQELGIKSEMDETSFQNETQQTDEASCSVEVEPMIKSSMSLEQDVGCPSKALKRKRSQMDSNPKSVDPSNDQLETTTSSQSQHEINVELQSEKNDEQQPKMNEQVPMETSELEPTVQATSCNNLQTQSSDSELIDNARKLSDLELIAENILDQLENARYLDSLDSGAEIELGPEYVHISRDIVNQLEINLRASNTENLELTVEMGRMKTQHNIKEAYFREQRDNINKSSEEAKTTYLAEVERLTQCLKDCESKYTESVQRHSIEIEQMSRKHSEKMTELTAEYANATQLMEANRCQCINSDFGRSGPLTPSSDCSENIEGDEMGRAKEFERQLKLMKLHSDPKKQENDDQIKQLISKMNSMMKNHDKEINELTAKNSELSSKLEELHMKHADDNQLKNVQSKLNELMNSHAIELENYTTEVDKLKGTLLRKDIDHKNEIEQIEEQHSQRHMQIQNEWSGKFDEMKSASARKEEELKTSNIELKNKIGMQWDALVRAHAKEVLTLKQNVNRLNEEVRCLREKLVLEQNKTQESASTHQNIVSGLTAEREKLKQELVAQKQTFTWDMQHIRNKLTHEYREQLKRIQTQTNQITTYAQQMNQPSLQNQQQVPVFEAQPTADARMVTAPPSYEQTIQPTNDHRMTSFPSSGQSTMQFMTTDTMMISHTNPVQNQIVMQAQSTFSTHSAIQQLPPYTNIPTKQAIQNQAPQSLDLQTPTGQPAPSTHTISTCGRKCVICQKRARAKTTISYCNPVCKIEYFKQQCLLYCNTQRQ